MWWYSGFDMLWSYISHESFKNTFLTKLCRVRKIPSRYGFLQNRFCDGPGGNLKMGGESSQQTESSES